MELADNDASTLEAAERGDVTLQKRFRVNGVVYYYPYANYKVIFLGNTLKIQAA